METQPIDNKLSLLRMIQVIILIASLAIFNYLILHSFSFSSQFSIADSISTFVLLTTFTGLIFTIQRNHHSKIVLNSQNIGVVFLFGSLIVYLNHLFSNSYEVGADLYSMYLWTIISLKFLFVIFSLLLFLYIFWTDQQKIQEIQFQNFVIQKERENSKIQLNSLQQQFKPHFLFNSLNSINALTVQNPEEARRMIHLLSEFMRGSVKEDQSELVLLSQEINHIQLYTNIEKVRFGDRLVVNFSIPEKCVELLIPSLILQPIIENAIKYGLYGHTENVIINVNADCEDNALNIEISNPHDSNTQLSSKGTGYGLSSIRKKMLILFNQNNLLQTSEKNGIFTTTLKVPQL